MQNVIMAVCLPLSERGSSVGKLSSEILWVEDEMFRQWGFFHKMILMITFLLGRDDVTLFLYL